MYFSCIIGTSICDLQPTLTIGSHAGTAAEIEKTGAVHHVYVKPMIVL